MKFIFTTIVLYFLSTALFAQTTFVGLENILAYPNPFYSSTTLEFNCTETKNISVSVINATEKAVCNIPMQEFQQEKNKIAIELSELKRNYFCKIKSNGSFQTIKLIKN
jgi:hypothetical protein